MCKLMNLSIFLCFFAIQNASALTLKKGETLGSDGQIKSGATVKIAEAPDGSTPLKTGYLSRLYVH